jgi:peptidoglycan hydrolase-like amidase
MASGAWSGRVRESAKVGAIAIKQYAWWMIINHQPGHSWRGKCYDITDSEQYYKGVNVPEKTRYAVDKTWGISLRKSGRFFRTGWSGGYYDDGWHLGEDSVRQKALAGWNYYRILHRYLSPNLQIVRSW